VDYMIYPHWNQSYQAWVIAAPHPSYIMQGNHAQVPILQFAFQRALEIANDGLTIERPEYLLDPSPEIFHGWVEQYLAALKVDPDIYLSYDIETPYKSGKDEDDLSTKDEEVIEYDNDQILRCSFAYEVGKAVSVPWDYRYMESIKRLFNTGAKVLGWNSAGFDDERVAKYVDFNVVSIDGMLAWHVLNTSLEKRLGFVTPFYWKNCEQWKHLSDDMPAFYNAKDADAALRCWQGISRDLKEHNLWHVFDRHVIQLNDVLRYMSQKGIRMDMQARQEAEDQLSATLNTVDTRIQQVVPMIAKNVKEFKRIPKVTEGLIQVVATVTVKICPQCGLEDVKAPHFKSIGAKRLKAGEAEQPCAGLKAEKAEVRRSVWAEVQPFKLSKVSLLRYQSFVGHQPIIDRKSKKITFDSKAMKTLKKRYPDDLLYREVAEFKSTQKLLSVYVGVTQYDTVEVPDGYQLIKGELLCDEK